MKRHHIKFDEMVEASDGEWVKFSDVEVLLVELNLLRGKELRGEYVWHPVSEAPPNLGNYLCQMPWLIAVCAYGVNQGDEAARWNYAEVTHWMPLPTRAISGPSSTSSSTSEGGK